MSSSQPGTDRLIDRPGISSTSRSLGGDTNYYGRGSSTNNRDDDDGGLVTSLMLLSIRPPPPLLLLLRLRPKSPPPPPLSNLSMHPILHPVSEGERLRKGRQLRMMGGGVGGRRVRPRQAGRKYLWCALALAAGWRCGLGTLSRGKVHTFPWESKNNVQLGKCEINTHFLTLSRTLPHFGKVTHLSPTVRKCDKVTPNLCVK